MAQERRKDKARVVLKTGEGQRNNGTYYYRWQDRKGKRHYIYAKSLPELRMREKEVEKDKSDGIKGESRFTTVNDLYELWKQIKRGLKASTIDSIHTVLHQVLEIAVDDAYIRSNPSNNVLRELKQSHCFETEKRRGLTVAEQELFLNFLQESKTYSHWYPLFAVMLGTGLRVGELTGLRWCDIDLEEGIIDVNHNLVYYAHRDEAYKTGCYFNINTPKTKASTRQVPMMDFVKEAFLMEKRNQEQAGIKCNITIDGYTDFIFVNRFGEAQHQSTLNKALRRIIRDCNDAEFLKNENPKVLLPHFSCHNLRHTFTTRMVEAGVNVKVIQDALGHQDIQTTMNIYADVTKELKKSEFAGLDGYFRNGTGTGNKEENQQSTDAGADGT